MTRIGYSLVPAMAMFIAVAGVGVAEPVFAQETRPGCKAYSRSFNQLQNGRLLRASGGECGGLVKISIRFSGGAQYKNEFNKDGSPKDSAKYARVGMELIRKTDGKNVCAGQPIQDQGFNDFNLSCEIEDSLNPYDSESYTFNYWTNNVSSGDPSPGLSLTITQNYIPDT